MRSARGVARLLLMITGCAVPAGAQPQVAPFQTIVPGTTTKAEVELTLGDPRQRVVRDDEVFEYAPPRDVDAERVVVAYWPDSRTVARVDVYFKSALPADPLRERIGGTRVIAREHRSAREELYYPRLHGLILSTDGKAAAFAYISPRYLASVYVERFDQLLAARDLDGALVEAEKASAVDPEGAQGFLAQARYFSAIGNQDEALARYTAASGAKTGQRDKLNAALGLAALYETYRKAPERAEAEFRKAVALASRTEAPRVRTQYGDFLLRQKKGDEAKAEFERALELDSAYVPAHISLAGVLFESGAFGAALPRYETAAKSNTVAASSGQFWYRYGFSLADAGRSDEALAMYEKALGDTAFAADARQRRGMLYAGRKDYVRAIAEYREGLKLAPASGPLNRGLTDALLRAGLVADAQRQAAASIKLAPQDADRLLDMARVFGAMKKKKESLDHVRRAVAAGLTDRRSLTADPSLALLQNDGDFKKLIAQMK